MEAKQPEFDVMLSFLYGIYLLKIHVSVFRCFTSALAFLIHHKHCCVLPVAALHKKDALIKQVRDKHTAQYSFSRHRNIQGSREGERFKGKWSEKISSSLSLKF